VTVDGDRRIVSFRVGLPGETRLERRDAGSGGARRSNTAAMTMVLAALRTLVGLAFVAAAVDEIVEHAQFAILFGRWQLPHPEISVFFVAAVEIVCGALLTLGALVRPAALVLATFMVGEMLTAGRIDGGVHFIVPPILFVVLVFYAWRSGRVSRWSPTRRPGTQ
jgi:uncharacterized membrane protein YphA (DoxX/SURF4 family)